MMHVKHNEPRRLLQENLGPVCTPKGCQFYFWTGVSFAFLPPGHKKDSKVRLRPVRCHFILRTGARAKMEIKVREKKSSSSVGSLSRLQTTSLSQAGEAPRRRERAVGRRELWVLVLQCSSEMGAFTLCDRAVGLQTRTDTGSTRPCSSL